MTRGGVGGWWAAMSYAALGRLFLIATAFSATRGRLQRHVLPKSGEGPEKDVREGGSYEIMQVGELPDVTIPKVRISGQGDPGVRSTTLMLSEAALCLAEDADEISVEGGFWTPASMRPFLRDRMTRHAGLTFDLIDAL